MPTTFATRVPVTAAQRRSDDDPHGWTVLDTAEGRYLVTDEQVAAIELTGATAAGARRFLRANDLSGPVIEFPGAIRREIHLVTAPAKAAMAIGALRASGVTVYIDGDQVPLPSPTPGPGQPCWGIAPQEARWVPPLVAVAAAVRAATRRARLVGVAA